MIILRIQGDCQDRDFTDSWDNERPVNLMDGTGIEEVVFEYLTTERDYNEEEIEQVKELIKTGTWMGGEWKLINPTTLRYDTDVMGETFSIKSQDQINFDKETDEFHEAVYKEPS